MPKSRCFILGAGFSKSCGLPLADELMPQVWRSFARFDPCDNSDDARLIGPEDALFSENERKRNTIKRHFPSRSCDPKDDRTWPGFEEVITVLDEVALFQREFATLTRGSVRRVAEETKNALLHNLGDRISVLTGRAECSGRFALIKQFVQTLDLDIDSVISFNWDLLLEIAANDKNIPVCYQDANGPGVRLAKPHGSLNLVDSLKSDYERASSSINVYGLDTEWEYEDKEEQRLILRAQDPSDAWARQAWARDRLLVEPNTRKRYWSRWLQFQWVRALDMVHRADEIVIIGFSLPKTDLRPRILLQLASLERTAPRCTLVDPDAGDLVKRYKKYTGLDVQPVSKTLEEWL